jgi:hypothetical protein
MKRLSHLAVTGLGVLLVVGLAVLPDTTQAQTAATDQATDSITKIAQQALAYAAVLAAAGTISMAFVELVKAVLDLRKWFQQWMLAAWLGPKAAAVRPELLYLAIGDASHESVLVGQPLEKMMGQLQAAARIALDYPDKFPNLFAFLTTTDFETAAQAPPSAGAKSVPKSSGLVADDAAGAGTTPSTATPAKVGQSDRQLWRNHAASVRDISANLRALPVIGAEAGNQAPASVSDAAQARARLASLVGRKLDGFQLRTDFWWTRLSQALSLVLSVVLIEFAISGVDAPVGTIEKLFLGLVGGLVAPFAKDFSQALSKFANR